jgi:hypothetical protein
VQDIRQSQNTLELEKDGFAVERLTSMMSYDDFALPEKVKTVHLKEVKELLQKKLKTKNVAILEYLVRRRYAKFPISNGKEFEYA